MYRQETIKPYGKDGEKSAQVERMFDNIAPTYDKLNHEMSWNIDKTWRSRALKALAEHKPQDILDVATGTGDFAIEAAEVLRPRSVTGIDISEGMMAVGRKKVEERGLSSIISMRREDCMGMSLADNSFDAVTSAFGIRNFPDLDKGLREMCRVMKPGGWLCMVELSCPVAFPMRQLFRLYSHTIMPAIGRIVSKDAEAYRYLPATIEAFPKGEEMMGILRKAGFSSPTFKRLTGGICTMYMATK